MLAKNRFGSQSLPFNSYFKTPSKSGDLIQRIQVAFTRNISRFEIQAVCCAFAAWFSLPPQLARSLDNITCDLSNHTYSFLSTPPPNDYIDSSLFIPAETNNETFMTHLPDYTTNYFYLYPFDTQENSQQIYHSILSQTAYRFTNHTGFLTEKFNLLLTNFSFAIRDIQFAGNIIKQELIPQLSPPANFIIRRNSSAVTIANITALDFNSSGILLAICQKLGTAIDDYRTPKETDYPDYSQLAARLNSNN